MRGGRRPLRREPRGRRTIAEGEAKAGPGSWASSHAETKEGRSPMSDFWVNFFANITADGLIAIGLYFVLTRPDERRNARCVALQALGLIRTETQLNRDRATTYLSALTKSIRRPRGATINEAQYRDMFPLHFTRGAWNAMREGGFLPATEDPTIPHSLFTMNELATIANNNLRKLELVLLGESEANLNLMARTAHESVKLLVPALDDVLAKLAAVGIPDPTPAPLPHNAIRMGDRSSELYDQSQEQE